MKNNDSCGNPPPSGAVVTEDSSGVTDKLKSLAAYLDFPAENENTFEDLVLDGLNIYLSSLVVERIEKVAEKVIGKKCWDKGISEYIKSDGDVELLHSFFAVVTNYCSHNKSAISLMKFKGLLKNLSKFWFDSKYQLLFPFSLTALRNLTTEAEKRDVLLQEYPNVLIDAVQTIKDVSNLKDETLLLPLLTFLSNMTVTREARRLLLKSQEIGVFEEVFKCLDASYSEDVRLMVSRFVKHMTADEVSHWFLLQDEVNILPVILLPLAGNEEFTDEEYSAMPLELQYLESTKTREESAEVRENLLFAILTLCRLKKCREKIRDLNSYYILRELHKFETQESMIDLVEKIVDLLIRTEEEIGEKGDFVDFQVPELEQWLNGDFVYPEESSNVE